MGDTQTKNLINPTVDTSTLIFLYQNDIISKLTVLENLGLDPSIEKSRGVSVEIPSKENSNIPPVHGGTASSVEEANSEVSSPVRAEDDLSEIFEQRLSVLDKIQKEDGKRPKFARVADPGNGVRMVIPLNSSNGGRAFRQEQIDCLNDKAIKIDPVEISTSRFIPEYKETQIIEKKVTNQPEDTVENKKPSGNLEKGKKSKKAQKTKKSTDKVEWKTNKMGKVDLYKNGKKIASQG